MLDLDVRVEKRKDGRQVFSINREALKHASTAELVEVASRRTFPLVVSGSGKKMHLVLSRFFQKRK